MRRKILIVAVGVFWAAMASAQQTNEIQMRAGVPAGDSAKTPKITKQQRERALQLLESADGPAHGIKDPASRAFALLQLARVYKETDSKKAVETLEEALTATRAMEDDPRFRRTRARLQEQILDVFIPLAPDKIDDVLGQVDANGREKVLQSLLRYHLNRKENEKALGTIERIAQEFEIPYDQAAAVMANLSDEQAAQRQQLFTSCLASYRDHDHQGVRMGNGDFGNLVVEFHQQLPPALVHQAVDVLLDDARKRAAKEAESSQPTNISLSSSKGAIALSSYYDFRLFQLLPVLKSIDPEEAEKLLKERQDVQTLLTKYPNGLGSISPELTAPRSGSPDGRRGGQSGAGTMMSVSAGGPDGPKPGGNAPRAANPGAQPGMNPLEAQRMAKMVEDASEHPQDSIASAATISSPEMRVQAYLGIARATWKKNSSAAKMALGKASDGVPQLGEDQQLMALRELTDLYLRLEDTDSAKKTIEKGLDAAEKLLKKDTNADDPNQAPKAYWPSTGAYRSMLAAAAKISPVWAVSLLKEIPDEDLKALNQIAIANSLLQVRGGMLEVMQFTKDNGRMMMMQEDRGDN